MLALNDPSLLCQQLFINGEWVDSDSGHTFAVQNPATNEDIAQVASAGKAETRYAIRCGQNAMQNWQQYSAKQRSDFLKHWHQLIVSNADDLALILTAEQGKPLAEAKGEILYGAAYIEWFAEEARRIYGDVIPGNNPSQRLLTIKQPVGVVAAITPWNFPNAMIARKVAPALAAGCAVVVKPAEATPLSALALALLAERAGMPKGLMSVVVGADPIEIGTELTQNPTVKKLSFTGSTRTGKLLIKQCADTVKKTSMELGGNAPFVVFNDANLEQAVTGALASKFRNAGQTCVCANRFLVQRGIYDEFVEEFVAQTKALRVGNGMDSKVSIGPLINRAAVDNVQAMIQDATEQGATVELGGKARGQNASANVNEAKIEAGSFFPPTIVRDVTPAMRLFKEEIFGPVAPIIPFDTEEQALELANATDAGLASYLFTQDLSRIWRFSEQLENGIVGINEGIISTEVAPFGGVKQSGNGREGSKYGIDDYIEIKYLCLGGLEA